MPYQSGLSDVMVLPCSSDQSGGSILGWS